MYLNEHAVHSRARRKVRVQRAYDIGHEVGGILGRYEQVAVVFLRDLEAFGEHRRAVADNKRRYVIAHKLLEAAAALGLGFQFKICALDPADYLESVGVKVIIKSGKLKRRAVHVRHRQKPRVVIAGGVQRLKAVFLHDRPQQNRIFTRHCRSPLNYIISLLILTSNALFCNDFYNGENFSCNCRHVLLLLISCLQIARS